MAGLLDGFRVVESGVLLAVGRLGSLLGEEGADVIKIEVPGVGDYLRNVQGLMAPDWSFFHLAVNRGKRSVTIDAKTDDGHDLIGKLLGSADVFITGNVGDTNRKLGLDYDSVKAIRPDIVYCQITGFGASGPYREIPTHGNMMEALAGVSDGRSLGDDGLVRSIPGQEAPLSSGGVVLGPLEGAYAIAAGLARRARTGEGCFIDISCADAVLAADWLRTIEDLNPSKCYRPSDAHDVSSSAKYQYYQTLDGKFILFCCVEAKFWDRFCDAVERPDLKDRHDRTLAIDYAFRDVELRKVLQQIIIERTLDDWMTLAVEHHIAIGPAHDLEGASTDPHMNARGMFIKEDHPVLGAFETVRSPIHVAGREFEYKSAPALGEHTNEVLSELGVSESDIDRLRAAGVL